MVLLTTTSGILDALTHLSPADITTLSADETAPLPISTTDPISHTTLIKLSHMLRSKPLSTPSSQSYTLSILLTSTRPYFPPPPPPPAKTPEYLALQARLLAESEAKQYNSLLPPDLHSTHINPTPASADDDNEDNISPSLVLNIFLSILLCAAATWYLTRWFASPGFRILLSLFVGIVVGIAEVTVYAGYLRKVRESRIKERKKRERKVVVRQLNDEKGGGVHVVIDRDRLKQDRYDDSEEEEEDDDDDGFITAAAAATQGASGSESVIWGKGKHGGMRRRVREKWEKEREKGL